MVIDFHTHVFPDKIVKRAIETLEGNIVNIQGEEYPARTDATLGELIRTMKEDGVDYSVVLPIATTVRQSDSINRFACEINGKDGIISFGSIHPLQDDYEEVLEKIKEAGLIGIKLHLEYQGVFLETKRMINILKKTEELGLYVVFHAGSDIGMPDPVHCTPESLSHILGYVRGDKIIAAHMGGWKMWEDVERFLVGTPIMFDTSYVGKFIDAEQFRRIVRGHGSEKILFGTDHPWERACENMRFVNGAGLDKDELENVYYRNAARILGISI